MTRLAVLLRGVNVGGANRMPMADLREALSGAGFHDVRTLLASGNVVLSAERSAEHVGAAVARAVEEHFGLAIDAIVRTQEEIAAVVAADPLRRAVENDSRYFVSFLSAEPPRASLDVDPDDYAPERFAHLGRELYFWCPDGSQRSELVKRLGEKQLGVRATLRNWNTVTRIHAILGGGGGQGPDG